VDFLAGSSAGIVVFAWDKGSVIVVASIVDGFKES
jgi:hypothetical protein